MILLPAIDIQEGNVVRLEQGRFDDVTEYSADPVAIAKQWEKKGAQWLHCVDLDGAKSGSMVNQEIVVKIAQTINIPVEIGGGIRTKDDIAFLLERGIKRVILGTKIVEDPAFLEEITKLWPGRIAISLDCQDGFVAQHGWVETSEIKGVDLAKQLSQYPLACIIYTDIKRDGMLTGPDINGLKDILSATQLPVIASGGISSLDDLKALLPLEKQGVIGAISGKALYEGKFNFTEALEICSQKE